GEVHVPRADGFSSPSGLHRGDEDTGSRVILETGGGPTNVPRISQLGRDHGVEA
ncbi:hypothetical protein CRG98_049358, partial [Punica granatum]